jgi:hypothetical protein
MDGVKLMTIYQHRASITASSGETSSTSLNIRGGLLRQVYIISNTNTTVFMANLIDDNYLDVLTWGSHTGNINDTGLALPVQGKYTLEITNASPDDTFTILIGVEE